LKVKTSKRGGQARDFSLNSEASLQDGKHMRKQRRRAGTRPGEGIAKPNKRTRKLSFSRHQNSEKKNNNGRGEKKKIRGHTADGGKVAEGWGRTQTKQ